MTTLAFLLGAAVALAVVGPPIVHSWMESRRRLAWETGLLAVVQQLAGAATAGRSLAEAFVAAQGAASGEVRDEVARLAGALGQGQDLEPALTAFRDRAVCEDVDFLVAAVLLQHRAGGSLGPLLEGIVETLSERARLRGLARSLTAQGRLSAKILLALPLFLGCFIWFTAPHYVSRLWTFAGPGSPLNLLPVGVCVLGLAGGYLWIRKLTEIDC
ncbi:MAG: type II secretion system F family protein [Candidatus Riflebacteria bacterium]|nr:type II secretion system F family protein [Candidatus Riflebacteria bacterium]